jgi:PIN domain nuclease of toxin-antitoxin system
LGDARQPANLSATAARLLSDPANLLIVSIASLWEITIKVGIGRLSIPNSDIEEVISNLEASHHKDPFDRIIVSQAQVEDLSIVTSDQKIRQYAVRVLL